MRFAPPPAPDIAAQVDAHLEIAIGPQYLRAQAIAALIDILVTEFNRSRSPDLAGAIDRLLSDFWAVDALITAMRFEQQRVRVECYIQCYKEDPTP